jgi:hypothetical protein
MAGTLSESDGAPVTGSEKRWWLAIRGVAEGPYTAAYVTASLRTNSVPPDTLACLVGTQEWKALTTWTEFGTSPALSPPPVPQLPPPQTFGDSPFTNASLPSMANWLCLYCILWRPVVSIFALLNWIESPAIILLTPPTSLIATAALMTGGIRLRQRRRSGVTIIKVTLWVSLGVTTLFILAMLVAIFASTGNANPQETPVPMPQAVAPSESAAGALMLLIWLLELAFQVYAVVWLSRNSSLLPYLND